MKNLFSNSSLGFKPYSDYKPTYAIHVDSPGVYRSDKFLNLCTLGKVHIKCGVIDGSEVNGIRESILFSFI